MNEININPMSLEKDNELNGPAVDTPAKLEADADSANSNSAPELKLATLQEELTSARGKNYWHTLESITQRPGFDKMMEDEFPQQASEWLDPVSRRNFLKLMGASLGLAGLAGCTKQPWESIVPYVKQPEELVPGKAMYYATAMPLPTGALPVLVKSNEYRPTKIEGNPDHPVSTGATDVWAQASILDLYDPDRSQTITFLGETRSWATFIAATRPLIAQQRQRGGAGLRILTGTNISPTFSAQMKDIQRLYPQAKWIQYEPVCRDNVRAGHQAAFGRAVEPQYSVDKADVILSLDADFLSGAQFPGFTKYARQFAARRKPVETMNRLYVIESTMTTTGGKAEHRLPLRSSEIEHAAAYIANALGYGANGVKNFPPDQKKFLDAVVKDLQGHRGKAVVIPGEYASPNVHALAAHINNAIGAVGQTVFYGDPIETDPQDQTPAFKALVDDMNAGRVELLLIAGQNPLYSAPYDFGFEGAIKNLISNSGTAVHLGLYKDETTRYCQWHINQAHYLESWSDVRTPDGSVTILQPLIDPLYAGKTPHELIAVLGDDPSLSSYDIIRQSWAGQLKNNFEAQWRSILHNGMVPNSASAGRYTPSGRPAITLGQPTPDNAVEIIFRPDPSLFDGRFSNNSWLQEVPKPVSHICWDNAILMNVRTMAAHGFKEGDEVEIDSKAGRIQLPVFPLPGQPENSFTVYLGFGRTHAGRVGTGVGRSAYLLRTSSEPWHSGVNGLKKISSDYAICTARGAHDYKDFGGGKIEHYEGVEAADRGLVRVLTLEEFTKEGEKRVREGVDEPDRGDTLYPNYNYDHENQWGMTIDHNACVGCNTCVIACQSENNIPTVGRMQVQIGREMLWLRIDTYFTGDVSNPRAAFLPVPCMHCENAPCEPVCPVGATVHSPEGLNVMVYNRCVGTRYCSNNCPYKVRRFNFLLYADYDTPSLKLHNNPDVTVRSRGVMEKCTYCVQRITAKRIEAEKQARPIKDMEVLTACQQACPTDAITFGNINDPNSAVSREKRGPRNYAWLASVNTRPRTSYLAGVINPNGELGDGPLPEFEHKDLNR
ncbi:MAG TPA: TAT-variant-translocated molybdopterin oxidoreductase [Terriglobales bacterium]